MINPFAHPHKTYMLVIGFIFAVTLSIPAKAQRWFEVEVLIFKRAKQNDVKEDFELGPLKNGLYPIKIKQTADLLTDAYFPPVEETDTTADELSAIPEAELNGFNTEQQTGAQLPPLPDKELNTLAENDLAQQTSDSLSIEQYNALNNANEMTSAEQEESSELLPIQLPLTPEALPQDHMDFPYILAPEQLQLINSLEKLAGRPGIDPLLHIGWRFPGQSKRRAPAYRIYAGQDFSNQFDYFGQPTQETYSPYDTVLSAMEDDNLSGLGTEHSPSIVNALPPLLEQNMDDYPARTWEVDGVFKVHLNHYLYISTEFNLRELTANPDDLESKLNTFYFNQFRRVISGEIHYFDHPRFGMLVQIRKFKH